MREATLICMAHTAGNRRSQSQGFSAFSARRSARWGGLGLPPEFLVQGSGAGLSTCISNRFPGPLGLPA